MLLNLIRTHRTSTPRMLAERCGVSERTVYRDLATLSEAGAPIYYDNGYKILPGVFLPPLNLSADEYLALKIALAGTPLRSLKTQNTIIHNLKAKIDAAVNSHIAEALKHRATTRQVLVRDTSDARNVDRNMNLLQRAIDESHVVKFDYASVSSVTGSRCVEPYYAVFRGRAWYLLAYAPERGALRTYRIDRIQNVEVLDRKFSRDRRITPESYFRSAWEVFTGELTAVTVRFTGAAAKVVATGRRHPDERVTRLAGGAVEYRVEVAGIDEIARWILGFGGEATVSEPQELRRKVYRLARGAATNHR